MRTHTQKYTPSKYHTQLAKMSFDEIFDLTAGGVYLYFYIIYQVWEGANFKIFPVIE